MEKKTLTPTNVVQGDSFPSAASVGDFFFRSDIGSMYAYDGTTWVSILASGTTTVDGGDVSSSHNTNWDGGGPSTF